MGIKLANAYLRRAHALDGLGSFDGLASELISPRCSDLQRPAEPSSFAGCKSSYQRLHSGSLSA